nr:hypothetical protein [Blautia massiliensis (ex Durand et al. 2017)]
MFYPQWKDRAVTFSYDDGQIFDRRNLGFAYSRTVESTENFRIPEDFMRWTPSCHHNDAFRGIAEKFLHKPDYQKLPLLYVWGHSFEFEREQTWEQMESFCRKISNHENVWYTTNMDYVNYMNVARNLIFNAECTYVENLSKIKIYCKIDGECQIL